MKNFSIIFNKNTVQGFTRLGFLVRIFIYSGILITLVLPSLEQFSRSSFIKQGETEAQNYLETVNRLQEDYHLEKGYFSNTLSALQIPLIGNSYSIHLISPMIPVVEVDTQSNSSKSSQTLFTIAQPLPQYSKSLRSYIGAVFWADNQENYIAAICQMNKVNTLPQTVPILNSDKTIQCPPGSTLLR